MERFTTKQTARFLALGDVKFSIGPELIYPRSKRRRSSASRLVFKTKHFALGKLFSFHTAVKKTNGKFQNLWAEWSVHSVALHLGIVACASPASKNRFIQESINGELSLRLHRSSWIHPRHPTNLLSFMRASPFSPSLFHGRDQTAFFDDLLKNVRFKFKKFCCCTVVLKTFDRLQKRF